MQTLPFRTASAWLLALGFSATACGGGSSPTPPPPPSVVPLGGGYTTRDVIIDQVDDGDLVFTMDVGPGHWSATGGEVDADSEGAGDTAHAASLTAGDDAAALWAELGPASRTPRAVDFSSCQRLVLQARATEAITTELLFRSRAAAAVEALELTPSWQSFTFELSTVDGEGSATAGALLAAQRTARGTPAPAEPTGTGGAGGASAGGASAGGAAAGGQGSSTGGQGSSTGGQGSSTGGQGSSTGGQGSSTGGASAGGSASEVPTTVWAAPTFLDLEALGVVVPPGVTVQLDEIALEACTVPYLNPPQPLHAELPLDAPSGSPVAEHGYLHLEGTQIVDQYGEAVQLKGVSSMWLNWESGYATNLELMRFLRDDWNIDLFRAAMGVQEAGGYAQSADAMRGKVEQIIANALELGVYVIVDYHSHAAESNTPMAMGFFADLAERYGQYPNIIWETYNEPVEQDWATVLLPYHEQVVSAIREKDPDNLVVVGTSQWSQKVDEPVQAPLYGVNVLYTLHFYSCTHTQWLRDKGETALEAGLPLFITEWGATDSDGGTSQNPDLCLDEAETWLTWAADRGISWAAWKLESGSDKTCLAPVGGAREGGWSDESLTGHTPFVVEWLRK